MINYAQFLCFCSMKGHYPVNTLLLLSRRAAPLAATAVLLAAFGATPASASVGSTPIPFNGFFNTTVSRTGSYATGSGTSTNSPLGIVMESYSFRDYGNLTPEHNGLIDGTIQFSDGSSILYAVVVRNDVIDPAMNYYNFNAYVPYIFSPTLSTGKFAGATGDGILTATSWNSATGTNTHVTGAVIRSLPAVPETSSVVSLGILLTLGVGGVLAARKKAARAA